MSTYGKNLKKLRKEHNLSQFELAEKTNLSKSSISKYEAGYMNPKMEVAKTIADFFGVSIESMTKENMHAYIKEESGIYNIESYSNAIRLARESGLSESDLIEIIELFKKFRR